MAKFEVPIVVNDQTIVFPVDDVESEEEARAAVQMAIESGQLDLSVVAPEPKFRPRDNPALEQLRQSPMIGMNPIAGSPETAAGILSGINRGVMNAIEFGLLAAEAITPEAADAGIHAKRVQFRQWRQAHDQRLQDIFDEALGDNFRASGLDEAIGETLLFSPLGAVGHGKTWLQGLRNNVLLGGIQGGILGAETADTLADTFGEASIGALFGTAVSAAQAGKGVRTFAARQFAKELDKAIAQSGLALERQVQRMT